MIRIDSDESLEALLRDPQPALPDAGFSAAVAARVRALPRPLEPVQALIQVELQRAAGRRDSRFNRYGIGLGSAVALAAWFARGGDVDLSTHGPALILALIISAAAVAWSQLSAPD